MGFYPTKSLTQATMARTPNASPRVPSSNAGDEESTTGPQDVTIIVQDHGSELTSEIVTNDDESQEEGM